MQVDAAYYAALPAALHSEVTVRVYARDIEILDPAGSVQRRHPKSTRKGQFVMEDTDRLFNPSRESARLLAKVERIGPHTAAFARALFARLGRPGQRAIYGLSSLARTYACADIEAVCTRLLEAQCFSYAALKHALERHAANTVVVSPALTQSGPQIRALTEYQSFFETHATHPQEDTDGNVYH